MTENQYIQLITENNLEARKRLQVTIAECERIRTMPPDEFRVLLNCIVLYLKADLNNECGRYLLTQIK